MTINKAQGQTLKCVGLDLRQPVFTHGMLYVALSRTGDRENIHYLAPNGWTRNVVYTEVLYYTEVFRVAGELICFIPFNERVIT